MIIDVAVHEKQHNMHRDAMTTALEPPRSPTISLTEMTELVLPQHANALGTAFGGTVMAWTDICAAISAQRHCGAVAVTASVDDLTFLAPIRVGDVVRLTGRLNAAFGTSVEIEVQVQVEERATLQRRLAVRSLLTFVLVDEHGNPKKVPPLAVENDDDARRVREAKERRDERLRKRKTS